MSTKKITEITEKKKKVYIVGFAPSWQETPWTDMDAEIWGINELYRLVEQVPNARFTRWFEIHDPNSPSKKSEEHWSFLKNCSIPLYMQQHYNEFPNSMPYPREAVKAFFNTNFIVDDIGSPFTDYSNQISWMTALAIYEGFEEIRIYGVDMAQKSEYAWQRASCQFFIGFAAGRGIKILIPRTSELCKFPKDYGFETDNQSRHYKKGRKKDLNQRINAMQTEINKLNQQKKMIDAKISEITAGIYQCQGAIQEINHDLENNII